MSKLTFWKSEAIAEGEHQVKHSMRFRTRREALSWFYSLTERSDACPKAPRCEPLTSDLSVEGYRYPIKVVVEYSGGVFGLLDRILDTDLCDF